MPRDPLVRPRVVLVHRGDELAHGPRPSELVGDVPIICDGVSMGPGRIHLGHGEGNGFGLHGAGLGDVVRIRYSHSLRLSFAWDGPELPRNVQTRHGARDHEIGDGVAWPHVTERQYVTMITANGCGGSNDD